MKIKTVETLLGDLTRILEGMNSIWINNKKFYITDDLRINVTKVTSGAVISAIDTGKDPMEYVFSLIVAMDDGVSISPITFTHYLKWDAFAMNFIEEEDFLIVTGHQKYEALIVDFGNCVITAPPRDVEAKSNSYICEDISSLYLAFLVLINDE